MVKLAFEPYIEPDVNRMGLASLQVAFEELWQKYELDRCVLSCFVSFSCSSIYHCSRYLQKQLKTALEARAAIRTDGEENNQALDGVADGLAFDGTDGAVKLESESYIKPNLNETSFENLKTTFEELRQKYEKDMYVCLLSVAFTSSMFIAVVVAVVICKRNCEQCW